MSASKIFRGYGIQSAADYPSRFYRDSCSDSLWFTAAVEATN